MPMMEKAVYDTKDPTAKSEAAEAEAQAAFEELAANTNASVDALSRRSRARTLS